MDRQEQVKKPTDWRQFVTLPEEKLLLVKRKHWFVFVKQIALAGFFALALFSAAAFVSLTFFQSFVLFLFLLSASVLFGTVLIIQSITAWYFHLYVITNRKLLEIYFHPLTSYAQNDVLLDQVRCTEVDVETAGVLYELLGIGDINITFDRPTRQQEFILQDVHDARRVGNYLSRGLLMDGLNHDEQAQSLWFHPTDNPDKFLFTEEIYPENPS